MWLDYPLLRSHASHSPFRGYRIPPFHDADRLCSSFPSFMNLLRRPQFFPSMLTKLRASYLLE